jgi:hypothetical protein
MRVLLLLVLLLPLLLVLLGSGAAAFYGSGSDVIRIATRKDLDKALASPYLYMVELYREVSGCIAASGVGFSRSPQPWIFSLGVRILPAVDARVREDRQEAAQGVPIAAIAATFDRIGGGEEGPSRLLTSCCAKMVGVAAVDVEKHRDVAQALMQEFSFEVSGDGGLPRHW